MDSITRFGVIPGGAPALGPYSPMVEANGFLFVSGQTPYDPALGRINRGTVAEQTRLVLQNLETVLAAAGADRRHVVSCRVFLQDLTAENFQEMSEVYGAFFGEQKPTRTTVGCNLLGMDVEIEAIAVSPQTRES
jgi:2-iminobutanoate/2-iminopropanoate deaminase